MSDIDSDWKAKSDDEIVAAAMRPSEYDEGEKAIIRAEFLRRGIGARSPAQTPLGPSSPIVDRYRDAYRVGAALVGLGNAIKIVGAILAGVIFLTALSSGNGPLGNSAVFVGILVAGVVGVLFWVFGVVVAAQGQILRATLDNAVASSHFLSDLERAEAMGLPRSIADRGGE